MDIIKSYKKNVVENKKLVLLSTFIAIILRLLFFNSYDQTFLNIETNGYLWTHQLSSYLSNNILSFSLSILFTTGIVLYSSLLNNKYKLIRNQTYLVYIFTVLFFSSQAIFVYMSPEFVSLLLLLISFDILMGTYLETNASFKAYTIGFLIGFASLFSFDSLIYILVFWVGFKYMRCLNLRTLLASLLGSATIYWIAFFYFLSQNDTNTFLAPFEQLYPILNNTLKNLDPNKIIFLTIYAVSLIIMLVNYQVLSFQDKIQTRANLFFIFTISFFSFLSLVFICYNPILNLFIFTLSICFLLSHFFTLVDRKWKVYLFYIVILLYTISCIYFLLIEEIQGTLIT